MTTSLTWRACLPHCQSLNIYIMTVSLMFLSTVCVECGGTVIKYDAAAVSGFCVACRIIVEENTVVNHVRDVHDLWMEPVLTCSS